MTPWGIFENKTKNQYKINKKKSIKVNMCERRPLDFISYIFASLGLSKKIVIKVMLIVKHKNCIKMK